LFTVPAPLKLQQIAAPHCEHAWHKVIWQSRSQAIITNSSITIKDKSGPMKEWYFSNNGEVSGPLGLAESNQFIATNPNAYAWHPSYAQWIPVCHVDEFDIDIAPPPPPQAIPQKLIERFIAKEQELNTALGRIDSTLKSIASSLGDLDRNTNKTKTVTQNLNQEVKTTLQSINEQYEALQKTLAGFATKQ
jgi:uncharacterized protein YukE